MLDAKGVMEPYEEPRQARGWLILLLGIVVFAAFGVVVGYAYYKGLPGIGGEPPLIKAEPGAYRRAPDERGGLAVANANSSIVTVLRQQGEAPRVERLLPPETAASLEAAEPDVEQDPGAPVTPPAAQPTPATPVERSAGAQPAPVAPVEGSASETDAGAAVPVPASKPAAAVQSAAVGPPVTSSVPPPRSAAPSPAAETTPAAPAPSAQRPTRLAAPEPPANAMPVPSRAAPALPVPPPPPAVAPAQAAARAAPTAEGSPQRLVRAEPAVPPPTAVPRAAPGAGVYRLQLAAVRSETGLTQAWADLRQRYPRALATASPQVERTDTSSGPLFRLQAGPFTNRDAAVNACGAIRSSGGQCFIVGPIGE
ncbi:MAG: SPOR domain-containing protein [Geminicoccaceae bacterium]